MNTCRFASDGDCDDGGSGSEFHACRPCEDCQDCGVRANCMFWYASAPAKVAVEAAAAAALALAAAAKLLAASAGPPGSGTREYLPVRVRR